MLITPDKFHEIDQEYLERLIQNGIEENINLEYKTQLIENKKIAKIFSSFANADGGNVLFGIHEVGNKPEKITPITDINARERIDQVSQNGIAPPLNIRMKPVDVIVDDIVGQVFVVYIPKKYPHLHYTKSYHRYYKRANMISIPMEDHEIREAHRLIQIRSEEIYKIISEAEQDFIRKVGVHDLQVRFIIWPIDYGLQLFQIDDEMRNFFENEIPEVRSYKIQLLYPNTIDRTKRFGQDYYIFQSTNPCMTSAMFKTDGIVVFNFQFDLPKTDIQKQYIRYDDFYTGKFGLTREKIFPFHIIAQVFLTLLEFLEIFYSKIHYWNDINIELKIYNISVWKDIYHHGFSDDKFKPVELRRLTTTLKRDKFSILETLFNNLFNGYGWTNEDKKRFLVDLKSQF